MNKVTEIYRGVGKDSLWKKEFFSVYHLFGKYEETEESEVKIADALEAIEFLCKILKLDDRFGIKVDILHFEEKAGIRLSVDISDKKTIRKLR